MNEKEMYITLTRDGIKLHGKLEKKQEDSTRIAIIYHGFAGDIGDTKDSVYQRISDELNNRGIATIRFDFNGHGKSEGNFSNMNIFNEINDAITILEYVRTLDWVKEIYIVGHSQGGVVAGMTAGYYADVVSRLVLLAPAASLKTDAQQGKCMMAEYDTNHIPIVVDVDHGFHLVGGHYFRIAKSLPIFEVTAQFEKEALVIIGAFDEVVDVGEAKKYGETMKNCNVTLLNALDHGLYGEDQKRMIDMTADFLQGEEKK